MFSDSQRAAVVKRFPRPRAMRDSLAESSPPGGRPAKRSRSAKLLTAAFWTVTRFQCTLTPLTQEVLAGKKINAGGKYIKYSYKTQDLLWNISDDAWYVCMCVCIYDLQPTLAHIRLNCQVIVCCQIQFICIFFILIQRCNLSCRSLCVTRHLRGKSHQWWNRAKYGWLTDGQKKKKKKIIKNNSSEPWRTRSAFPASDWLPSLLSLQKSRKIITTWNVTGRSFDQWPCEGPASYEPSPRRPGDKLNWNKSDASIRQSFTFRFVHFHHLKIQTRNK